MQFERGNDPKESLRIGGYKEITKGTYFRVRFRDRRSRPDFYPIQQREKEGIAADALAKDSEHINSDGIKIVHCIVNRIPHEQFTAFWSVKEKCWIVGRVEYTKTYDTGPR